MKFRPSSPLQKYFRAKVINKSISIFLYFARIFVLKVRRDKNLQLCGEIKCWRMTKGHCMIVGALCSACNGRILTVGIYFILFKIGSLFEVLTINAINKFCDFLCFKSWKKLTFVEILRESWEFSFLIYNVSIYFKR